MTSVRKLYTMLCGYEIIRKSACLRGASRAQILAVPICAYLLETNRGFVIFDTGLDPAWLVDSAAAQRTLVNDAFPSAPIVLPEHTLEAQLATIGVARDAVCDIILSHAHPDHTGGLKLFPHARVWVQRLEYEAVFSDTGREVFYFSDMDGPIKWQIMEGDWNLMPGIEVLFTPGHRLGHQSACVTLPSGARKILVGDVVDLLENFDNEVLGSSVDDIASLQSLKRLKQLASEPGTELIPLHDPNYVQTARLAPEYHD
jgi:N-acyl homoserine lactone hydrolase